MFYFSLITSIPLNRGNNLDPSNPKNPKNVILNYKYNFVSSFLHNLLDIIHDHSWFLCILFYLQKAKDQNIIKAQYNCKVKPRYTITKASRPETTTDARSENNL